MALCLTPDWSCYCGRNVLLRITVRSRAGLVGIYGERCSTGTGFSSVPLPSPVIIPPMLRALLHLNTAFFRRTIGGVVRTVKQKSAAADVVGAVGSRLQLCIVSEVCHCCSAGPSCVSVVLQCSVAACFLSLSLSLSPPPPPSFFLSFCL